MNKTSLIGHTVEAFGLILSSPSSPADKSLNSFFRGRRYLGARDRRFIADTAYGMIRDIRLIEFFLGQSVKDVPSFSLNPIFYYVAYALKILPQNPDVTASEVADLWQRTETGTDLPSMLRSIKEARLPSDVFSDPVKSTAIQHSFPEFAARQWFDRLGRSEATKLCSALNTRAPLVIRVNLLKGSVGECRALLAAEGVESHPSFLTPESLVLTKAINVNALRSFAEGWFELQDEGSQIVSHLLAPQPGETVVDACAGAGGKSLHLAALMGNTGTVLAFDSDRRRLRQAAERAERAGATVISTDVSAASLQDMNGKIDRVLVDAPCSGIGTVRRNPWIKRRLSPELVKEYHETQLGILAQFAPLVRPGGRLVYSTCSLMSHENEDVLSSFRVGHPEFVELHAPKLLHERGIEVEDIADHITLFPHRYPTDGFFLAAMQRSP